MSRPTPSTAQTWRWAGFALGTPMVLLALVWWLEHNLSRARVGLIPSTGTMTSTDAYSTGLIVVFVALLAYLGFVVTLLAIWFRNHRTQHPRLWATWVRVRDGQPQAPSATGKHPIQRNTLDKK